MEQRLHRQPFEQRERHVHGARAGHECRQEPVRLGQRGRRADGHEYLDAGQDWELDGLEVVGPERWRRRALQPASGGGEIATDEGDTGDEGVDHLEVMAGLRGDDELPQSGDGPVGLLVHPLGQIRQDLGEEGVAHADEMEPLRARDDRLEVARGLGKVAPLVGDDPEKGRAPARRDGQIVRLGELQLIGGRLFAAGQAPRLPEHEDAPEVAPDRRRVDPRRFAIGERREPRQRLVFPSDRGQGHAQHQVGITVADTVCWRE